MEQPASENSLWREVEEYLKLLDTLRTDKTRPSERGLSLDEDALESKIYECLSTCLRPFIGGKIPPQDAQEVISDVILEILNNYPENKTKYRLKDYSSWVTRSKMSAYFRKQGRYVPVEDEQLERLISQKEKDTGPPQVNEENPAFNAPLHDVFRLINLERQELGEKEFLVFVLKAASFCMEKKLPEAKLAAMVGLKRTTFRDMYQKAKDKIYQEWRRERLHNSDNRL